MHGAGAGLYLNVKANGALSWVLRTSVDGRQREIRLRGFPAVSLVQARDRAAGNRLPIAEDATPFWRNGATPTFAPAAGTVHALNRPRWRSKEHADDWWATLARHALPMLGRIPVDRVDQRDCWPCSRLSAPKSRKRRGAYGGGSARS